MGLSPEAELTPERREEGLRRMVQESGFANAAGAVTTGVILTAFALQLGASNSVIGLLAALPFLGQLVQAPTILLVEKLRTRKKIAVLSAAFGRSLLVGMAALAFFPGGWSLTALILLQAVYCGLSAVGSCAWNAWVRDLAPDEVLGQVFGRRTLYATAVTMVAGLAAAVALDLAPDGSFERQASFAGLYVFGAVAGMISVAIVAGMPEPQMPGPQGPIRLLPLLQAPLRDHNFRRLIAFLASWQFAINLATPFFTVFMVRQLGYPMTFVMAASVASQLANAVSLISWGRLSDRFANKSVLAVTVPLYILCVAGMVGASQIQDKAAGAVYLTVLHIIMGAAVAGVTLASTNIALKLSPKGSATGYLAANAMISSLAAGLAPIIGGLFADFFGVRRLEVLVRWIRPGETVLLAPFRITGWDFYFVIAAALGLYALHRLSLVREVGEIERRQMLDELMMETGRVVRSLSSVGGLRTITAVPGNLVREAQVQARLARARLNAARRAAAAKPARPARR